MASKDTSDEHNPVSESGAHAPSEGPQTGEGIVPLAKVESDPQAKKDEHKPGTDAATSESSESESSESESSELISSPCTCRCNGCCCHSTSTEPQHCVRCHANYRLNHPEACAVPHVFTDRENYGWPEDCVYGGLSVPSLCCGADVCGAERGKADWKEPFPCFLGWHTTDVDAVAEQYNGVNVLRCNLGPGGACRRTPMKHSIHYELLYDWKVKYVRVDKEDHENYLKRKREEIKEDDEFRQIFIGSDYESDEEEDYEERMRKRIKKKTR